MGLLTFVVVLSSPPVLTSLSFVFWHIEIVRFVLYLVTLVEDVGSANAGGHLVSQGTDGGGPSSTTTIIIIAHHCHPPSFFFFIIIIICTSFLFFSSTTTILLRSSDDYHIINHNKNVLLIFYYSSTYYYYYTSSYLHCSTSSDALEVHTTFLVHDASNSNAEIKLWRERKKNFLQHNMRIRVV